MSGYTKEIQKIINDTYKPALRQRKRARDEESPAASKKSKKAKKVKRVWRSPRTRPEPEPELMYDANNEHSDSYSNSERNSYNDSNNDSNNDSDRNNERYNDNDSDPFDVPMLDDIAFTTTHPLDSIREQINELNMTVEHAAHCNKLLLHYERDEGNFSSCLSAVEQIVAIYNQCSSNKIPTIDKGFNTQDDMLSYLNDVWDTMENSTYGHQSTKDTMIEYLTGRALGINRQQVLGLCGPSGIGKTTLVTNGLSKALGLPFHQVSLGGLKDSTFFNGTARYWKGAHCGVFANILAEHGPNCVVYLDEIDKVAPENAIEIYGYLTHAFDPLTNNNIHDNYLGIGLDLSGMTFILSFNDADNITNPLLDRMNSAYLKDFDTEEKSCIVINYLLPEILETFKISDKIIKMNPNSAKYLSERLKDCEGVRTHKQVVYHIISKLLVKMVTEPGTYNTLSSKCPNLRLNKSKAKAKRSKSKAKAKNNTVSRFSTHYAGKVTLPYTITNMDIRLILD